MFRFCGTSTRMAASAFCESDNVNNMKRYNAIKLITINVRDLIARDIVLAICVVFHGIWNVNECSEGCILYIYIYI